MQAVPGAPAYAELRADSVDAEIEAGLTVRICSYDHLAAMKRASGRSKDELDLEELGRLADRE